MKVLAPTTAFPRFEGDVTGNFILYMFRLIKDVDFKVLAPSDIKAKRYEKIGNVEIERFSYTWPSKYQKLTYGEGIHSNLKKSFIAKMQIPLLGIGLTKAILKYYNKFDLIHAQMVFAGYASYLTKNLMYTKRPLVISFYGKDILNCKQNLNIYRPMLNKADLILALTKNMEKMLLEMGVERNKIIVHHLGIDCNKLKYKKPSNKKDNIRFLIVARFIEKKGIDYGIKAFSKVVKKYPKSKLVLVGDGPEVNYLLELTKNLKLEKNVEFINNLKSQNPREVTLKEFYKADIFLLPSITTADDYGGAPIVLTEAEAVGLPCIVFEDAGNSEIVLDKRTGYVVEQKNIDEFAKRMIELIENPRLRNRFSTAGRKYIEESFNNEIQPKKLKQIYTNLLNNKKL